MEQYLALYRQWRPQTFSEVVGQEHITRTLKNAVLRGRLVHAYLFCGPRGTGKTSTARVLAKVANCQNPQSGEPCNTCPSCVHIATGNSLDVIEIDAASNRGIDEIRALREKIALSPIEGRYKVYIIDEVHMLTTEAFNALLKTLEEPPSHAFFILATTEPRKVPLTIISRCQRYDFRPLKIKDVCDRLRQVAGASGFDTEEEALEFIARKATGGMRDALGLLDQVMAAGEKHLSAFLVASTLGLTEQTLLVELGSALASGDGSQVLRLLDKALQSGQEPRQLLADFLNYGRDLLLLAVDPQATALTGATEEILPSLKHQAQQFGPQRALALLRCLQGAEQGIRWSDFPRVELEMALVQFLNQSADDHDLERRLVALEQKITALEESLAGLTGAAAGRGGSAQAPAFRTPVALGPPETTAQVKGPGRAREQSGIPVTQKQTGSGATTISLENIKHRWPEFLAALRKKSISLHAFLREGEPVGLDGETLTLAFKAAFHMESAAQPRNKAILEQVCSYFWGQPLKLIFTLNSAAGSAPRNREAANIEKLARIKELFGAEVVENGNDGELGG